MDNIDLPDGPKTPRGAHRLAKFAIIFAFISIFAGFFNLPALRWIADFGLDHLILIVSIAGIMIVLYKSRGLID